MAEMEKAKFTACLQKTFSDNGLSKYLSATASEAFWNLTCRMLEENEKYNLTAIRDMEKIVLLHYADCVAVAHLLPKGAKVVDVGCGAGFPTLPLAIVRPDVSFTAMDSTERRVQYVTDTATLLGLSNVCGKVCRAEEGAKDPTLREVYDVAMARAVAEMRVLTELCLPYVRVGGEMLALKGRNGEWELREAKKAIALLGGGKAECLPAPLKSSFLEVQEHLVLRVKKEKKTPDQYPRNYSQISKKPL